MERNFATTKVARGKSTLTDLVAVRNLAHPASHLLATLQGQFTKASSTTGQQLSQQTTRNQPCLEKMRTSWNATGQSTLTYLAAFLAFLIGPQAVSKAARAALHSSMSSSVACNVARSVSGTTSHLIFVQCRLQGGTLGLEAQRNAHKTRGLTARLLCIDVLADGLGVFPTPEKTGEMR